MNTRKPHLLKTVIKFCSRIGICRDTEKQCKPKRCRYFKYIVLPTWLKDIKGRHKKHWKVCKEYKQYEDIIDYVY